MDGLRVSSFPKSVSIAARFFASTRRSLLTVFFTVFFALLCSSVISVQNAYASPANPEGCISFISDAPFEVTLGHAEKGNTWDGTVEYSLDESTWIIYSAGTVLESNADHAVFFRGSGNSVISAEYPYDYDNNNGFSIDTDTTHDVSCNGNINNLLDYRTVALRQQPPMEQGAFMDLFYGCTSLSIAPKLPAMQLAESCYYGMFKDCVSLTVAPKLPATQLADYCYESMFEGCVSLTVAPKLPATQLAERCYGSMFCGCTSLVSAPALPATRLASACYHVMFSDCTSLASAPALPATQLADVCYSDMFTGCTSLASAPKLPATRLAAFCYSGMFRHCTSLASAPKLPATQLAKGCYANMFSYCTSLATTPELPATQLAEGCYGAMFRSCTSLVFPPELPATQLAEECYSYMFYRCTGIMLSEKRGIFDGITYGIPYRIPQASTGKEETTALSQMFANTGGPFKGTPSLNKTYYLPGSISSIDTSNTIVTNIVDKIYTGKTITQTPTVKVRVDGKTITLKSGTDYTLSYKNNVNVGTATVTITGKGDYEGTVSKTFKIKRWKRLSGSTALDTMEKITQEFGKASVAIVTTNALAATGVDAGYKDALAGAALAGGFAAPMLTTSKGGLADKTRSELKRMGVKTVYVIGSYNEVVAKVDTQIKAMGITVKRINAKSASERAIAAAKQVKGRSDTVIIATQNNFKDALAISSYAYASKSPILYAESNKKLSAATVNYIKSAGFKKAIIVGGPVPLPASIEGQLKGAGIAAGSITRLAGSNQYKTARVVAEWAMGKLKNGTGGGTGLYQYASVKFQPAVKLSANKLGVARADDNKIGWKDALAGAALCGKNKSIMLLADKNNDAQAEAFVKANKAQISMGYIFGGTSAVPAAVMKKLENASNGTAVASTKSTSPGSDSTSSAAPGAQALHM